jgi:hypothetical protein
MRKVICFALGASLFGAGVYLLYLEIFVATRVMGRLTAMGGFLMVIGGAWLWSDFIVPLWQGREVG